MEVGSEIYRKLLDSLYEGVYFVDKSRSITYWNKGAEKITGFSGADVVGTRCWDNVLMHVDEQGVNLCKVSCIAAETINDGFPREADVYIRHREGHRIPVSVRVAPLYDKAGQIVGAAEIFHEKSSNTTHLERLEELRKLALLDPLTTLANNKLIDKTLHDKFGEMFRYGWPFGIIIMDVDQFKSINERYGHNIGDRILRMIARTLVSSSRSFDLIGRYAGEEFIAIVTNVDEEKIYSIANRFRILVEQSFLYIGHDSIRVTLSIGATVAQPTDTVDSILKRANELVENAKALGRNRISTKL